MVKKLRVFLQGFPTESDCHLIAFPSLYSICEWGLRREEGCVIPASINASDSAIIQTKIIYNKLLDFFQTYVYYIQIRL